MSDPESDFDALLRGAAPDTTPDERVFADVWARVTTALEQAEFEALFRETRGPLLGYLSRRAAAEDAADLLADVHLVAWRRRADLPRGDERRL